MLFRIEDLDNLDAVATLLDHGDVNGGMGGVVNGPGESRHADIGISLPGSGEHPVAPVYEDGEKTVTLRGDDIAAQFLARVESYIHNRFADN